jgi:hypothetical protein
VPDEALLQQQVAGISENIDFLNKEKDVTLQ